MNPDEERKLEECLNPIIEKVDNVITQLKTKNESPSTTQQSTTNSTSNDPLFNNSVQNNNVNTFTIDITEEELLDNLKDDIQNILRTRLPQLTDLCSNYIEQFLHEYHFNKEQRVFTQPFTASILYTFHQNLKGLLMAARAYPAALYKGDLLTVKKFIKYYSHYKDKSGFWGTTLLYSAARGGYFEIVKYLIESAGCYIDAQNQSDLTYVLISDNDTDRPDNAPLGYNPDPKAGSTALHAACFTNNLQIVDYLIKNGANYFVRNQLGETPIQNGKGYSQIQEFFRDYLVTSYINSNDSLLPDATVLHCYDRKPNNCIWEYKPINRLKWENFTTYEQMILSTSLMPVTDGQTFNTTIYLIVNESTYPVDFPKFFRGSKNQEPNPSDLDKQAWIRCRGSSIANFDIHCIWQLMFVKYESTKQLSSTPSLNATIIPSIYDSKFEIQLNSWYTCDTQLNDLLDETMNYRRKCVEINRSYIGKVICNLYTFEFASDNGKTVGFIRWIPKLIANTPNTQNSVKELDNFQPISQYNPIPLTTERLDKSIQSKSTTDLQSTTVANDENNETDPTDNLSPVQTELDDDDDDNTQSTNPGTNNGTWSLTDLINNNSEEQNQQDDISTTDDSIDDQIPPVINPVEPVIIRELPESENRVKQEEAARQALAVLEIENNQLKTQVNTLERQISEQFRTQNTSEKNNQQILNSTIDTLETTQKQLNEKIEREKLITKTSKNISIAEYNLPKSNYSILSKWNLIFKILKGLNYPHKEYFKDIVPMMDLHEQNDSILILKGFRIHHDKLKSIIDSLENLFEEIQLVEKLYREHINRNKQSVIKTINLVRPINPIYWKHYRNSLINLIRKKSDDYINQFQNYIKDQLKLFMNRSIENSTFNFQTDIKDLTNDYIHKEKFSSDIDLLKVTALNEFLHENVLLQKKTSKNIPAKESIIALNKHIDKLKILLTTNEFKGCELRKFQMIVPLLQRIMIYYNCFLLQLPLFDASIDLLNRIDKNTVLTIETTTGSGKSTLLPALLVAEGYDKIIVTQPRRLPCNLISERVNSMVNDDISGWAVSGAEKNVQAKILYVTDGLLKERLMNDENFITKNTTLNKSVIFFIDEVHERSINIDLCLGLFARLLKLNPELKTKMKVIISSATLDSSVPQLFKNIPNCSLSQFNLTLSTLYPVTTHRVPNENILDLVQKLYSERIRNDQILCFVSSTQDVYENCQLLKKITKGAIVAYPLVQSQSALDQQKFIQQGTVFFSTTVAETSLTFPCLKYVIDTGLINMPVYILELERTELREIKAAQSTTKQRLGRLGRTQPGEYYALYNYGPNEQDKYPEPQICQSDLVNIEFSCRKSQLKTNLAEFKQYLPKPPKQEYIDDAIKQLKRLELVGSHGRFTDLGKSIARLPDFSSLQMSKAVYYALRKYNCGRDLIILSSLLSVLNTSGILKSIPVQYKCPEGDFMTLLKVMTTILSVRDSVSPQDFKIDRVCNAKGLSASVHIIKQALRRCKNLERAFNLSDDFREDALIQSGNWESIAKALIKGFPDKVFVSLKLLQGKGQQFIKYHFDQQKPDEALPIAVIDRSSTLRTKNKGILPASLVLARDFRYLSAIRSTAIISFVGKIELTWLEYTFKRELQLSPTERQTFDAKNILQEVNRQFPAVNIQWNNNKLVIHGESGQVLKAELHIRQQLVTKLTFTLSSHQSNDNLTRNLKSVTNMPLDLFGPLRWRWDAEQQVKVRTKMNAKQGTIDVTVEGLDSQNQAVEKEFTSFLSWLRTCAVIRDPHSGVAPRVLKPQIRSEFHDMEAKITNITDPDRTSVDRWKNLKGPAATRETRMEVVAWIAVCLFDCRLEGGFVRDWVVGNYLKKPTNLPINQWVTFHPTNDLPILHKDLVPSDLDVHLPALKQFDVEAFVDTLYSYGITAQIFRQDWRYVLLIDQNYKTGPFTIDLIEPHIALTHDRIDFDVSNLSLEKLYTRDLGMRVDITGGSHPIQLETIVENIRKKEFQILRPIDGENGPNTSGTVAERRDKMKSRGWTPIGEPWYFIPNPPPTYNAILVTYPTTTALYQTIVTAIKKINGAKVISIEQIKNPDIESLYENMKRTIAKECPNDDPNERELFHGTSGVAVQGITDRGYDDRYFSPNGAWGRGAYFADDPQKSNGYTQPDTNTKHRVIFYNKVLLGIESKQNTTNNTLVAAPLDHHSVHGTGFQFHEYIVYRYGQALPYLKIIYTA